MAPEEEGSAREADHERRDDLDLRGGSALALAIEVNEAGDTDACAIR